MSPGLAVILFIIGLIIYKHIKKRQQKKEDDFIDKTIRSPRIARPKAHHADGRKKSAEERQADLKIYHSRLALAASNRSKADKLRHKRAGASHYIRRTCLDERVCETCRNNDGKKFSWNRNPKSGHPGEGKCCPDGLCRCYAEAVFK